MLCDAAGIPASRADDVLEMVHLNAAADRKFKGYSLGMRQRLGIAAALLGDPEVLILDEPANGLDPEGIRWMRDLLKSLADQGRTVLVSSHLLSEMEILADDVVIVAAGKLVRQGTVAAIIDSMGGRPDAGAHTRSRRTAGRAGHRGHRHQPYAGRGAAGGRRGWPDDRRPPPCSRVSRSMS